MGPRLWSVATGDGGSGLGEVTWDRCQLRVRLGGKSEEQGKFLRERTSAMLFSLLGRCDRQMVKLC